MAALRRDHPPPPPSVILQDFCVALIKIGSPEKQRRFHRCRLDDLHVITAGELFSCLSHLLSCLYSIYVTASSGGSSKLY